MILLTDVFSIALIAMGLLVAFFNLRFWRKSSDGWKWIKFVYGLIGLGWAVFYIIVLEQAMENLGTFGPMIFRPFLLVTLATMAAGALIRNKTI